MPLDDATRYFNATGYFDPLTRIEAEDVAVLKAARHLIRKRRRWMQMRDGTIVGSAWWIFVFSPHCALTAIADVSKSMPHQAPAWRLELHLPSPFTSVVDFNDAPTTTHKDILDLFDRAIAEPSGPVRCR